jgi:hypothetical protein
VRVAMIENARNRRKHAIGRIALSQFQPPQKGQIGAAGQIRPMVSPAGSIRLAGMRPSLGYFSAQAGDRLAFPGLSRAKHDWEIRARPG